VDLFEYQARDLFESHQIPVLAGAVAPQQIKHIQRLKKLAEKLLLKLR